MSQRRPQAFAHSRPRIALAAARSCNKIQDNARDEVEQKDGDLVKHHPGDVDQVKLLGRQMKQSAPEPIQPITRKDGQQKPRYQDHVVNDRAP
jgi:hypothetical protein